MLRKLTSCLFLFLLFSSVFNLSLKAQENSVVILATTTSVQDTGLLDILVERFNRRSWYVVKAVSVGTGQALQLGIQGEADILWVHSPDDERQFVEEGFGLDRVTFMHNDFVLLGPENDPAGAKRAEKITGAFQKIYQGKALFISRGDKSGTHKKELKIWKESGIAPEKEKYLETGQGMAQTAQIANEKQAYCLVDRSTYLSLRKLLSLVIVSEGDERLKNDYSLIMVNPQKFPKVNSNGAKAFFDFLLSSEAKEIVENFGKEKFGQQLFFYDYTIK